MGDEEPPRPFKILMRNLFKIHREGAVLIIAPIACFPVLLYKDNTEYRCMYLLIVMACYWIFESLPLGVTSMMPIIWFTLMDIMDTERACTLYFKDALYMFITSIMVAAAIEYSNLHIRLALRVLQIVGCSPRRLHLGICVVTMILSMWITNAGSTAMMCPIIYAVLEQLSSQGLIKSYNEDDEKLPRNERRPSKLGKCFYMSVAYSSSIGGCGTLIGTPTNLAFKAIYESRFPHATDMLDFSRFIYYALPIVVAVNILVYIAMEVMFMGLFRPNSATARQIDIGEEGEAIGRRVIDERYAELGPLTTHELSVALLFTVLVIMYVCRKPGFVDGWADLFFDCTSFKDSLRTAMELCVRENSMEFDSILMIGKVSVLVVGLNGIKNSVTSISILLLLFTLPANYKFLSVNSEESLQETPALLTWSFLLPRIPWGLLFVVGGGTTLSEGSRISGMATELGSKLSALDFLPPSMVLLTCIIMAMVMTNFSANVAMCNITLPVLAEMAVVMKIHPLYLMFPVTLGCGMAFLLPVGTPPNAIIQSYAIITARDMLKGGLLPTICAAFGVWLGSQTWGRIVYPKMGEYPAWADVEGHVIAPDIDDSTD